MWGEKMLDDRHIRAIEMLVDGSYQINDIAIACGVDRTTIWDWRKKNKEFIAALDRRTHEHKDFLKNSTQKKFENKLNIAIETITKIAEGGNNEAVRLDAARYIVERINGKIPSKITVTESDTIDDDTSILDDIGDWDEEGTE
jgi:hypothetical protein